MDEIIPDGYRKCGGPRTTIACGKIKPISDFYTSSGRTMRHCKKCELEGRRLFRIANPEIMKAHSLKYRKTENYKKTQGRYRKAHPEVMRETVRRRRARLAGAKVNDLTVQDVREILEIGKCAICHCKGKVEFDHIIPTAEGGNNTKTNGQALCRSCNAKKNAKILYDGDQLRLDEVFNP